MRIPVAGFAEQLQIARFAEGDMRTREEGHKHIVALVGDLLSCGPLFCGVCEWRHKLDCLAQFHARVCLRVPQIHAELARELGKASHRIQVFDAVMQRPRARQLERLLAARVDLRVQSFSGSAG
jgi:hypothetical protein